MLAYVPNRTRGKLLRKSTADTVCDIKDIVAFVEQEVNSSWAGQVYSILGE